MLHKVDFAILQTHNPQLARGTDNFCQHLIIAANQWANKTHKFPGYPNFIEEDGKFHIMTSRASTTRNTWANIGYKHLKEMNPALDFFNNTDSGLAAWARAINRSADKGYFSYGNCAMMTGEVAAGSGPPGVGGRGDWVRGAHGFYANTANNNNDGNFMDLPEAALADNEPMFVRGQENAFDVWTRAVYKAVRAKYGGREMQFLVFPNYEIGANRVHGAYVLTT